MTPSCPCQVALGCHLCFQRKGKSITHLFVYVYCIVIFSHRWIYDTLCIRVRNFLKGLQELAAHVVTFRNVTEAVSSVQVSRVAMVLPFVMPSFGKGLALVGWQLHRGWFETQLKATGFLERVSITSRSCVHYSIAFSKGVLFIICLRLTSFTGFEELKFACVSTGTGAIAIWWRLGSWAAHNTKHMTPSTVSPDMTSKQDPQCKRGRWAKVNVYRTYMNLQKYTCVRCSHVDCCQSWPKEWFAPTSCTVQHSATTEF